MARPTCAASAALWQDDVHVQQQRQALQRNWDMADDCLAQVTGYQRAEAGFFLWLAVADGEASACRLWTEQGLRVMPGRYLCYAESNDRNPGDGFVRVALVHKQSIMREALLRLREGLRHEPA